MMVNVVVLLWGVLAPFCDTSNVVPDWVFGSHFDSVREYSWLGVFVANLAVSALSSFQV
jgi:hypothetical protein